ncbi:MAG: amidase [Piscinibacter sp.]|uniref:amidase n=1 Tax=Piscinibacter sp. TaxID=1903157 RepID=UPI0025903665|nr:amidase [Piscinibacter sp.]MCW5662868.1 amidase [Piscinibacter sp.]
MPPRAHASVFVPYPAATVAQASAGPLTDLRLAVKDVFDVAGYPTGAGTRTLTATAPPRTRSASAVVQLLQAGARFVGKTHTDELAFSLDGCHAHFGAPLNPAAPDRLTGGSSSGSAAAVAAGLADVALGSDTAGSVRLPASHCGLYGFRPSHALVALDGMLPLAPSFDTCGWFARDAVTLARVAAVLLPPPRCRPRPRLLWPVDLWRELRPGTRSLRAAARAVVSLLGTPREVQVCPDTPEEMARHFLALVGHEAWQLHGAFVTRHGDEIEPEVMRSLQWARQIDERQVLAALAHRRHCQARWSELLADDRVLIAPTLPEPAPHRDAEVATLRSHRGRAVRLLCVAPMVRAPQLTLPLATASGAPIGLSLIGAPGNDHLLLQTALTLAEALDAEGKP